MTQGSIDLPAKTPQAADQQHSDGRRHPAQIYIVNFLKMGFVAAILYWLIATDRLHLAELTIFVRQPMFTLTLVLQWLLLAVFAGSLRWFVLLRGRGFRPRWWRVVQLQLIGFFFNSAMPGAIGGDLVKMVYVVRDHEGRRTDAGMTILLDRVVGLIGLFSIAAVAGLFFIEGLLGNQTTRPLISLLIAGMIGIGVFVSVVFIPFKDGHDPFERALRMNVPGFGFFLKIYTALRAYRNAPKSLLYAFLISVVIQIVNTGFYWYVTKVMTGQLADFGAFAVVFPFGSVATAIPLAPGGLGVGHVAFEKLYNMIGLSGGANVFNVIVLGTLALNMTGFIPYLLIKSKKPTS